MNIKINPVLAVKKYCSQKGGCGIQEANDICYNISSAYNDNCSAWDVPENLATDCNNLVNEYRMATYGVGKCDHQSPDRPLLLRNEHTFPALYNKFKNSDEALIKCNALCNNDDCKRDCLLDYLALDTDTNITSENFIQDMGHSVQLTIIVIAVLIICGMVYKYLKK